MRWALILVLALQASECGSNLNNRPIPARASLSNADSPAQREARLLMVRDQIESRGVRDRRVLEAMRRTRRHLFVPPTMTSYAYADHPLPIGNDQTISQPYIVAFMTEALGLKPSDRVLEIGTGSGYQAAILSDLCNEVYSIEIVEALGKQAAARLKSLGYENVHVRIGDGYHGWPEQSPFDAIIVTAAPPEIPAALLEQLSEGGRMVLPVGEGQQVLIRIRRTAEKYTLENLIPVMFVPMVKGEKARENPRD